MQRRTSRNTTIRRIAAGILRGALLSAAVAVPASRADRGPSAPAPLPLAWCLERAESANPDIEVEAARAEAAVRRIGPAGALDDPRLSYEASNLPVDSLDFGATPLAGHQLYLRQRLPVPGLLASRRRAAEAGAEAAGHALEDRRLATGAAVEASWAALGFSQRALEVTDRNVELLRQLTRVAEAKYSVGSGLQQDVLRAQVELTGLLRERLRREAAVVAASARLAALLDLPPRDLLPVTTGLADASPVPMLSPLLERLDETSPLLSSLSARVAEAERRVRASELEGYPDFDLGVGYRIRRNVSGDPVDGADFFSAGVSIRLPVNRSRWRDHVAEQRALLRRVEAELRGARARLASEVRASHAELVRAESESQLLSTGLVPQARQSLESSRGGYEVGRVDFPSLLDSQVRLLDAELRHVRALADRRVAFAALEAALGETLR